MLADDDDLTFLQSALLEAGRVAMAFHNRQPKHWHKPDGSIVTEGDLAVNESLLQAIWKARPNDAILSEESPDSQERLSKRRLWIIDPIDGTRNFHKGGTEWCIGVALIEGGEPIVSALFQPTEQRLYSASKGGGAYCNRIKLEISQELRSVIAPKSLHSSIRDHGLEPQGSSDLALLLRFARIAEGRLAGSVSIGNKKDWDIAAGHLILTEAGGLATTQAGEKIVYNQQDPWQPGLVAATPATHRIILKAVGDP